MSRISSICSQSTRAGAFLVGSLSLGFALSACEVGGDSAGNQPGWEQHGVLPVLDRSSDIRGPDLDNNGVRDDIDKFIAALPLIDAQRRAAVQTARVQQRKLLADLSDKAALQVLSDASMAATACFGDTFEPDRRQSYKLAAKIEAITRNTPERAGRAIKYMAAVSGSMTDYPEGNPCE